MSLPTGTVTFLFTDIEGSTKLWEAHPEAMRVALAHHDSIMRHAIESNGGVVFKTVGDAFCAAFSTAPQALCAALNAHVALLDHAWAETGPIRVRMGLHTGSAEERDNDYFGPTLNRTARLQGVAYAEQTLISNATYELVANQLPDGAGLIDLGTHRLKDLASPEHVWQLLHPSLPQEFAPLKTLDYLPTNLPQQLTSFVGREKEMAEIKLLLQKSRLVTLIGSGGTGKTRLALQAAAEVLEQYSDGAWLVELAALSDPAHVPQMVAQALGIREAAGEPITKTLLSTLKDKKMLIVLDNCEHVLDACARLVDALLKACPKVNTLASSREALRISGESAYRVPSLSLPDEGGSVTPETLHQYEAARLFIDRAVAARADFVVTSESAPALVSVCRRLDGIPLAIELAAARVRSLHLMEINSRLDQRFKLLTGGSRTAQPRQQTLRSMIDWSYDLLNEAEKALLCSLSVFAGGWTLEAAEAICTSTQFPEDVLDSLTSLVDKSLVVCEAGRVHTRYRLLETVRQYARDRLIEAGEHDAIRERHLDCFLALAEEAEPKLSGREQGQWFQRLEDEHENLRAALDWSITKPEQEHTEDAPTPNVHHPALHMCGALARFWGTRCHLSEGREWCDRALTRVGWHKSTSERAKVLTGAGNLAHIQGDYAASRSYHEQSLVIRTEMGDRNGIATALSGLGNVADDQGDFGTARLHHTQSLAVRREIGDRSGISASLNNLGILASHEGDYVAARVHYEESLAIKREIGDRQFLANALSNLGNLEYNLGNQAAAVAYYDESLAISREIGNQTIIGASLYGLGRVAESQSDYTSAREFYEESMSLFREIGHRNFLGNALFNLGTLSTMQGDLVSAQSYLVDSLTIRNEIGDRPGIAACLDAFARIAASQSSSELAARLYGAALALREEIGAPVAPNERSNYEYTVAGVRQAIGEQPFRAAWEDGRRLTMEEAIAMVLRVDRRSGD